MRFADIHGSADPVRVLHLTDPHLFADIAGDLRGTVTFDALQQVLAHYEARGVVKGVQGVGSLEEITERIKEVIGVD